MKTVEVSADFGGKKLVIQTGKLAKQADGSVVVSYGETMVLVTVVSSRTLKEGTDFFPLTVDFQEKFYAAGRFPGGFFKREAKPSDMATLTARMIDRPIRPLFPEDYRYDTQVVVTTLSSDGITPVDFLGQIGASAALHISDIPWDGPIAGCRVGLSNGEFKINLPLEEQKASDLDLLLTGGREGVVMVEGGAKELSEDQVLDAISFAHEQMKVIFDIQDELKKKVGKEKREYDISVKQEPAFKKKIQEYALSDLKKAMAERNKLDRYKAIDELKKKVKEKFKNEEPKTDAEKNQNALISLYFEEIKYEYARSLTLDTHKRIDGRSYTDIRPITCEIGLLPRVHGSAVFTRGETQVLSAVTLGTSEDEQKIDSFFGNYQKTFLLHYNFPAFSVGEARPLRGPGRREIGHGTLAERAISGLIPDATTFPYTLRVVAETLESNGSSSMATVCASSMALMSAGVPLKKPVAGVAMGLIKEGQKVAILTDILGDEDHLGDMDFKVCGTETGITAFQLDLKIRSVSRELMEKALAQAKEGRLHVLKEMAETISAPSEKISPYAPRIETLKIKKDKIRDVIGPGGKVIRSIIEETGVKMDVDDDGTIHVASADEAALKKAIARIENIVEEPEAGKTYLGRVTRVVDFGAFVEIIPGTEGLLHISELAHERVRRVDDIVREGDEVKVKCLEVDRMGKIRLSRKALLNEEEEEGQWEEGDTGEEMEASSENTDEENDEGEETEGKGTAEGEIEAGEEGEASEEGADVEVGAEGIAEEGEPQGRERSSGDRGGRGGGRGRDRGDRPWQRNRDDRPSRGEEDHNEEDNIGNRADGPRREAFNDGTRGSDFEYRTRSQSRHSRGGGGGHRDSGGRGRGGGRPSGGRGGSGGGGRGRSGGGDRNRGGYSSSRGPRDNRGGEGGGYYSRPRGEDRGGHRDSGGRGYSNRDRGGGRDNRDDRDRGPSRGGYRSEGPNRGGGGRGRSRSDFPRFGRPDNWED